MWQKVKSDSSPMIHRNLLCTGRTQQRAKPQLCMVRLSGDPQTRRLEARWCTKDDAQGYVGHEFVAGTLSTQAKVPVEQFFQSSV